MRLIDADALDKRIYNYIPISVFGSIKKMAAVREIIAEQPTVDAVPVKHGHWIEEDEEIIEYKCSECGVYQYGNFGEILSGAFHFCPNCGAKMDVEIHTDENRGEFQYTGRAKQLILMWKITIRALLRRIREWLRFTLTGNGARDAER